MKRLNNLPTAAALAFAGALAFASHGGPDPLDCSWNSIDGGGGSLIGGSLELAGTIGQHDASGLTGGGLALAGGFWASSGPPPVRVCLGDLSPQPQGNGAVDLEDLLVVIEQWGPCPSPPAACIADIAPPQGDGAVNIDDLLAVIAAWGDCP